MLKLHLKESDLQKAVFGWLKSTFEMVQKGKQCEKIGSFQEKYLENH